MKGLVILAALLLVPSAAYFQKQYFEEVLGERLVEEVRLVLIEGGVEEPVVGLEWMDATIGGSVATVEKRREVGERVEQLGGVRLAPGGNGLKVRGWVELGRQNGRWQARGMVPEDFSIRFVEGGSPVLGWDAELTRSEAAAAPVGAIAWERFLSGYFREAGDRRVLLRNGRLELSGEATEELRRDWLAQAAAAGLGERVKDDFVIHPSEYHFAGHVPEFLRDPAKVAALREALQGLGLGFGEGSAELGGEARDLISTVAGLMLEAGERVRFVVGVGAGDDLGLAEKRLEGVVALLMEYGVGESQLVKQVFAATLEGTKPGQVEFLLK